MIARGTGTRAAALLAALALGGCQSHRVCAPTGIAAGPPPPDWREKATDPDHEKLRRTRTLFETGLAQARAAGFAARLPAADRIYDPDFAEEGAAIPPGDYRCRSITLGSKTTGRPAYVAEPARTCTVLPDGALQRFADDEGPQRLVGEIYPDTPSRTVFLGTVALGDEATALRYGRDVDRDRAGTIERVGKARWRLTIADPAWDAPVRLIEIAPAG